MSSRIRCAVNGVSKSLPPWVSTLEVEPLTPREEQVAFWLGAAKGNSQIADILGCRPRTVETHVHNILKKWHLESRTEICSRWLQHRLGSRNPPAK
jgi:DNA-binding CsgD family transcriptional regulator